MQNSTIGFPHRTGGLCGDRHCAGSSEVTYDGHTVWKTAEAYARDHHADGEECPSPTGCDDPGCGKAAGVAHTGRRTPRTRPSVAQQIAEACAQLGLTLEDGWQHSVVPKFVVDGQRYSARDIADLVLEGGLQAAWNATATRVRQDSPLRAAPVDATIPVLVLHEEPALKTVMDEDLGPGEVWDLAVSYQCGLRHNSEYDGIVGWREHEYSDTYGADHITQVWVPFYEARLPGDPHPTRFCEDCAGWLTQLAPHLLSTSLAEIARHKLLTALPESYTAEEVSAMSDNDAIGAVSCGLLKD
ncbi:hypothetical protein BBK82_03150 [Lentzea guizhouensis]|uniref:Uncharacterized protein n=1 Tax=Lentzea guizhouensis TaxID=1586287 RepID=A0A1B2HBW8_9PSEU|nr:hypothetical protein [Lentzea guizhouensis]ANZ35214.1 hypothetical protein BBK82_03150 [Lentzea guizhouensis]